MVIHTVPCSSQHHKQTQGYCSGNPTDLTPTEMKQVKLHVHTKSHDNIIYKCLHNTGEYVMPCSDTINLCT